MIVADKPAQSWTDEDVTNFEIQLSDIARRFKNLEALQNDAQPELDEGFEPRKITVTRPDGRETHSLVWLNVENQAEIDAVVEEILGILNKYNQPQLYEAVVAKLTERVFDATLSNSNTQMPKKRKKQENE